METREHNRKITDIRIEMNGDEVKLIRTVSDNGMTYEETEVLDYNPGNKDAIRTRLPRTKRRRT